jgi:hypothetical protein
MMAFKNSGLESSAIWLRRSGRSAKSLCRKFARSSTSASEESQVTSACSGVSTSVLHSGGQGRRPGGYSAPTAGYLGRSSPSKPRPASVCASCGRCATPWTSQRLSALLPGRKYSAQKIAIKPVLQRWVIDSMRLRARKNCPVLRRYMRVSFSTRSERTSISLDLPHFSQPTSVKLILRNIRPFWAYFDRFS